MSAARARRLLIAGFAISLIVHLFLAGYIRWPLLLQPRNETAPVKVRVLSVARIAPRTPPPTPPPTPVPTPIARASVAPPQITTHAKSGQPEVHKAVPSAAPATPVPVRPTTLPTPVAIASNAPSCVHSDLAPSVSATPDPPEIPAEVRAQKASGTAAVTVGLDAQGRVTSAAVAQSSGSGGLDSIAVEMARSATYTPKYVACKAVASTYTFTVRFAAW